MSAELLAKPKVRAGFMDSRHYTFQFAGQFVETQGDPRPAAVVAIVKRICWQLAQRKNSEPDTPMHFYEMERFPR